MAGTGVFSIGMASLGGSLTSATGTQTVSAAVANKYVGALDGGSGAGSIHAGCVSGSEKEVGAVAWIPAHNECAGIIGMSIPIEDKVTSVEGMARITNYNFEAGTGSCLVCGTSLQLPGMVESGTA